MMQSTVQLPATNPEDVLTDKPRVLIVCPTIWDKQQLAEGGRAERYAFFEEDDFPTDHPEAVNTYIDDIVARNRDRGVQGVISTHDYPGSIISAAVGEALGLHSPAPCAVLQAQHKLYSRKVQREVAPEATPEFEEVATSEQVRRLTLPYFIKPIKSVASHLATKVSTDQELERYLDMAEEPNRRFVSTFDALLKRYGKGIGKAEGFIAERLLTGKQVTVEVYCTEDDVCPMGVVDSIMYRGTMSFLRFEYPARIPDAARQRMMEISCRLARAFGLRWTMLNVEFFYDCESDTYFVIEVNPRMSYQFSDLFEKVDGTNSYDIQLALAQGRAPQYERGAGNCAVAASFVLRSFSNATVVDMPSSELIYELMSELPGLRIIPLVSVGERLSDHIQQLESFRFCVINLGATSWKELYAMYGWVMVQLRFDLAAA